MGNCGDCKHWNKAGWMWEPWDEGKRFGVCGEASRPRPDAAGFLQILLETPETKYDMLTRRDFGCVAFEAKP